MKFGKKQIIILGLITSLLISAFPFYYDTDDATDSIVKEYGHDFSERIRATSPQCTDDGIGVKNVPFGTRVSYCGSSWFVLFNTFPYQVSGGEIPFNKFGHEWQEYTNKELEFAVMYPSDIAQPYEASHPSAEAVNFYDNDVQSKYVTVWVQETPAENAHEWFDLIYGPDGKGWYISSTSTVAGELAVSLSEMKPGKAHDGNDLNFVHGSKAWSLYIDDFQLSQEEREYIRKSFRFLSWWEKL